MAASGAHVIKGLDKSDSLASTHEKTYHARLGGPLLRLEEDGFVLAALCALFLDAW
jgi:hypothetical protein